MLHIDATVSCGTGNCDNNDDSCAVYRKSNNWANQANKDGCSPAIKAGKCEGWGENTKCFLAGEATAPDSFTTCDTQCGFRLTASASCEGSGEGSLCLKSGITGCAFTENSGQWSLVADAAKGNGCYDGDKEVGDCFKDAAQKLTCITAVGTKDAKADKTPCARCLQKPAMCDGLSACTATEDVLCIFEKNKKGKWAPGSATVGAGIGCLLKKDKTADSCEDKKKCLLAPVETGEVPEIEKKCNELCKEGTDPKATDPTATGTATATGIASSLLIISLFYH